MRRIKAGLASLGIALGFVLGGAGVGVVVDTVNAQSAQAASTGVVIVDVNSQYGLTVTGSAGDQHYLYPGQSSLRWVSDANAVWLGYGICWKVSVNGAAYKPISVGSHSIPNGYLDKFSAFSC